MPSYSWLLDWQISIDGVDSSAVWNPYVIQIEAKDSDSLISETATITLDDSNGQIKWPKIGSRMLLTMARVRIMEGWVTECRSQGSRSGGRILKVGGQGFDAQGKAKQPQDFHLDDATMKEFLEKAAKPAGITKVLIDKEFDTVKRDHWSCENESFIHVLQRCANEVGGTARIKGTIAGIVRKGSGLNVLGEKMPTITATWGDNLINWDISPFLSRPRHSGARVRWYDRKEAKWKEEDVDIEMQPESKHISTYPAHDSDTSKHHARGKKYKVKDAEGEGTSRLELAPNARVEGTFRLDKARPGVDGDYRISGVQHQYDKDGGSVTTVTLKNPDAIVDNRKVKAKTGGGTGGTGAVVVPEGTPASESE